MDKLNAALEFWNTVPEDWILTSVKDNVSGLVMCVERGLFSTEEAGQARQESKHAHAPLSIKDGLLWRNASEIVKHVHYDALFQSRSFNDVSIQCCLTFIVDYLHRIRHRVTQADVFLRKRADIVSFLDLPMSQKLQAFTK